MDSAPTAPKNFVISSLSRQVAVEPSLELERAPLDPAEVLRRGAAIVAEHQLGTTFFDISAIARELFAVIRDPRYSTLQASAVVVQALGHLAMEARAQVAILLVNGSNRLDRCRLGVQVWQSLRDALSPFAPEMIEHFLADVETELDRRAGEKVEVGATRLHVEGVDERVRELAVRHVYDLLADAKTARSLDGVTVVVVPAGDRVETAQLAQYVGSEAAKIVTLDASRLMGGNEGRLRLRSVARSVRALVSAVRPSWIRAEAA